MASKKKKSTTSLHLELSPNELTALEVWAEKNGVSLEDYAKTVLISSVPFAEQAKLAAGTKRETSINEAYELLEKMDPSARMAPPPPPSVSPNPRARIPSAAPQVQTPMRKPAPSSSTGMLREQKVTLMQIPQVPPGPHPCFNLSTANIPGHLQGQCQGVCQSSEQRGRICYWAPASARQCDYFNPRPQAGSRP